MTTIAPLGDTQRVIDWAELPASVREIPEGFDPLADGVLMLHQRQWIGIRAPIKVAEKGRRTGITFAEALDCTITAGSRRSAGGDNVFYIGDTKEKGLEFVGYCARFARVIAMAQGQGVSCIEQYLFDDQNEQGNSRQITAYRIRFASGFAVVALSSRPANVRGLQGKVVIDEAAYHADVRGVLDAATALLIWGGTISIISTHNGKASPFNELCRDIRAGQYGEDCQVFRCTFDDAVTNGLYERRCMKLGEEPTDEGKQKWYTGIRAGYGPRKAAMREELDAIPRDGNGICIPTVWIERAMKEPRPILRWALDDDFAKKPNSEREAWANDWIMRYLLPELDKLDKNRVHVAGQDFARHRHFSCVVPLEITQSLTRRAPFVLELNNVPSRQQEQIVWKLFEKLPRFSSAAMDATGPGMVFAEYTADKFGRTLIHEIDLSRKWYGEWMPKMQQKFEDGSYDLPADVDLEGDLRIVEDIDGIPMVRKAERRDFKEPELVRHGDFAIALVMAEYAACNRGAPIEFMPLPSKHAAPSRDDDNPYSGRRI